jgi:hypothetical protein
MITAVRLVSGPVVRARNRRSSPFGDVGGSLASSGSNRPGPLRESCRSGEADPPRPPRGVTGVGLSCCARCLASGDLIEAQLAPAGLESKRSRNASMRGPTRSFQLSAMPGQAALNAPHSSPSAQ